MPLSQAVVEPWEELTGGYLVEGYGLSRDLARCSSPTPSRRTGRPGTVGLPLPNTEIRVVDPDEPTKEVPPGEPGELLVRGPQVFSGYWRKPDATAAVFVDGWFRTGDIVRVDEQGFVKIVDRIKELVITGGFNVSPSEVEDALRSFEGVEDIAIVGIPERPRRGARRRGGRREAGHDGRRAGAARLRPRDAHAVQGAAAASSSSTSCRSR